MLAASISMSLMFSGTASASLLSNVLNTVTIPQGVTQLTQGVQGLLTGGQASIPVAQSAVQGFTATLDPTIAGQITSLQTRAQALAADAAALDSTAAQADLMAAVTSLQTTATGVLGSLSGVALTQALTNGLSIAQQVVSPICSILGTPAALAAGVGVDLTRFYPLSTAIPVVDQTTNNLLKNTWSTLYDAITATVPAQLATLPAPAGSTAGIVSALLTLLKYNWTTTYYPPNGGTPIVNTTKSLLDVPTPIDVDNSGSYDLCATTTLALDATSGQLKVGQQITKLPLAKADLPVDVSGALLGVIGFGYETKNSTAPVNFTSNIAVPGPNGDVIDTDNTYSVHRGWTLTLPPLLNNFVLTPLPFGLGSATLPNIPALTQPAPTPRITQVVSIGGSVLQFRFRHDNEPNVTHAGVKISAPSDVAYTGSGTGDGFGFATRISSGSLTLNLGTNVTPSPTSFDMCGSTSSNVCNPTGPDAATDKGSLGLTASQVVQADQFITGIPLIGGTETTCPGVAIADAHLHGQYFRMSQTPATATASGKLFVDTQGNEVTGCVAAAGLPVSTLPAGFKASSRRAVYTAPNVPTSKTGSITCPPGTSFSTFTATLCFLPPVNTVPPSVVNSVASPGTQPWVGSVETGQVGSWDPPAPNAPNLTLVWQRCDASGGNCTTIPGETSPSYTPTAANDLGKRLRIVVTATNLDGVAMMASAPSPVVTLPPVPVNTGAPVISGSPGVGNVLTTSNGTWSNPVTGYTYQWRRCADPDDVSTGCVDIPGATNSTYTPTAADSSKGLVAVVTAHNDGGDSAPAASAPVVIPGAPLNTVRDVPDGAVNATAPGAGGSEYVGGSFDTVGPAVGEATAVSKSTGSGARTAALDAAATGGPVKAVISDGTGGYYIGGAFTKVRGAACAGLAHIAADGTVDPAFCLAGFSGEVRALDSVAGAVVVGGSFTLGSHQNLVFLNGTGAVVDPSTAGDPDGPVNAIANDSADSRSNVFVGGDFNNIGSDPAGHLALYKVTTGPLAVSRPPYYWSVSCSAAPASGSTCAAPGATATVNTIKFFHTGTAPSSATTPSGTSEILVGGVFDSARGGNGTFNNSVTTVAQKADGSGPIACTQTGTGCTSNPNNLQTVYSAGNVPSGLGGTSTRQNVVAFNEFTSRFVGSFTAKATDPATPGAAAIGTVTGNGLAFIVYFGATNTASVQPDLSPAVLGWNPNANGAVRSIATGPVNPTTSTTSGSPPVTTVSAAPAPVYLGGSFTSVGSGANAVANSGLAEFGISTAGANGSTSKGATATSSPSTTWVPTVNGAVNALSVDSAGVYVGGSFTVANGSDRSRAAFFGPAAASSPAVGAWDPHAGQTVRAIANDATSVFLGGDFNVVNGVTRRNLAQLDPATGVTAWDPNANGAVNALAVSGSSVYAGGSFTSAGGQVRTAAAELDPGTGAATAWDAGIPSGGTVNAIALDGPSVYLGGAFGGPSPNLDKVTGGVLDASFAAAPDGPVNALLVHGTDLLVGGSFSNAGGPGHANIAEVSEATGFATGFSAGTNGPVNAIATTANAVYVGGAFTNAGLTRSNLAAFTNAGGPTTWNPGANGTVTALRNVAGSIVAGGGFTTVAGKSRAHAAALDPITGQASVFNPGFDGSVRSITTSSTGALVTGGSWQLIGATYSPAFGTFGP